MAKFPLAEGDAIAHTLVVNGIAIPVKQVNVQKIQMRAADAQEPVGKAGVVVQRHQKPLQAIPEAL